MTSSIDKALVEIRKEIRNPAMDSKNPHFKSKFASLKAVIEATVVVAAQHGVAVVQDLQEAQGGVKCFTHLIHESGESRTFGPLFVPCTKQDAQGYASASTYARRYHLQGVFCVVGDDDDDGHAASQSSFGSSDEMQKIRSVIITCLAHGDGAEIEHIFSKLNNDQKAEIWSTLSKSQQKDIKALKEDKADGGK